MSEYMRLLGAEEVAQAGRNIAGAADQITRAAEYMQSIVDQLQRSLEWHATCIQEAMNPASRRVLVSERVYEPGTRNWITRDKGPAMFLRWGSIYEEFENGVGNQSVAIVQFPDGTIDTVVPHLIRFEVSP